MDQLARYPRWYSKCTYPLSSILCLTLEFHIRVPLLPYLPEPLLEDHSVTAPSGHFWTVKFPSNSPSIHRRPITADKLRLWVLLPPCSTCPTEADPDPVPTVGLVSETVCKASGTSVNANRPPVVQFTRGAVNGSEYQRIQHRRWSSFTSHSITHLKS